MPYLKVSCLNSQANQRMEVSAALFPPALANQRLTQTQAQHPTFISSAKGTETHNVGISPNTQRLFKSK